MRADFNRDFLGHEFFLHIIDSKEKQITPNTRDEIPCSRAFMCPNFITRILQFLQKFYPFVPNKPFEFILSIILDSGIAETFLRLCITMSNFTCTLVREH